MINVISMWYNEEIIAPFFLAHYEDWVDKIFIFLDTSTTDETPSILAKHPKVKVIPYTFPAGFDDRLKVKQFNDFYRGVGLGEYIICVDADEFVFPFDFSSISDVDVFSVHFTHPFRNTLDHDLDPTQKPIIMQRRCGVIDNPYYIAYSPQGRLYTKPCVVKTGKVVTWHVGQHAIVESLTMHPEPLKGVHWQSADPTIVLNRHTRNRLNCNGQANIESECSYHFKNYTEERVKEECRLHLNDELLF